MNKKEILETTENIFINRKKYLEDRIECIKLQDDEVKKIVKNETLKIFRDKFLGLFKVTDIINTFLKWNEDVKEELKRNKEQILFSKYFEKNDKNELAIYKLKEFLTNPHGIILLNKILRILDDNPPDKELFNYLTNVLNNIVVSDFISMFDSHKYVLNLIENISPQGLVILADYKNWPPFETSASLTYGEGRLSLWSPKFSKSYLDSKNILDEQIKIRIEHAIDDLISKKFIHYESGKNKRIPILTEIGKLLNSYIS